MITTKMGKLGEGTSAQITKGLLTGLDTSACKEGQNIYISRSECGLLTTVPWYRKDKYGFPIETVEGERFGTFVRILLQNIRKIIG